MKKFVTFLLITGIMTGSTFNSFSADTGTEISGKKILIDSIASIGRTEKNQTEEAMQEQQEEGIPDKESLERAVAVLAASSDIGWAGENGIWFYRDENGQLCKGWKYIAGKWYYFDPTYSYMYADGWRNVREEGKKYYFTKDGDAYTGWLSDTQYGIWYYFREGQYRNGWVQSGSNWYYLDHGKMVTDEPAYEINGAVYGFDKSGVMCTGWKKHTITMLNGSVDTDWYYYDDSGKVFQGWVQQGSNWYYCIDGWIADDGIHWIGNDEIAYALGNDGVMITGSWYYDALYREWYYVDENGTGHNKWLLDEGKWYYCINGKMLYDCWYQTGENEYSQFDRSGVWLGSSSTPG